MTLAGRIHCLDLPEKRQEPGEQPRGRLGSICDALGRRAMLARRTDPLMFQGSEAEGPNHLGRYLRGEGTQVGMVDIVKVVEYQEDLVAGIHDPANAAVDAKEV